jgi:aurora kinase
MNPQLNSVKTRFLPIPESALKGFEREAKIQDFEIIKELGVGSFGNVFLVKHKGTQAEYAIKAIDKRSKANEEEKPYFKREVEVMYKIHHPNVVKLYGHFEDNNYCYFIMEYISKGNVYNLLPTDKKKRLSTKICASIIKDIISAVYFLHHMNPPIIHRDIKPENVLLSNNLVAKLTDFGWSNYIVDGEKRTTMCGTPIYLAPEIILDKGHDETVDLWCIGVLLFELATATVPFAGENFDQLKENILKVKINWPKDINTDAKNLIMKILKYEPKQRLPLEEMIKHPFITKFHPDAPKSLILPVEGVQYKPFIVSVDNPKTWVPEKIG